MKKVIKKLKLTEVRGEKLISKEMKCLVGGCACASLCTYDISTAKVDDYVTSHSGR